MAGTKSYRFGDLLALARRSWTLAMARELEARGHAGYRISDAASVRLLRVGPMAIGELAGTLGVTRQAAAKVVLGLEARGLATTVADPDDRRKRRVTLTADGEAYADAVIEVIEQLNAAVAARVTLAELAAADTALRAAVTDPGLRRWAARIDAPG